MSVADVVGGQAGISVEIHRYPKRDNSAAATTIDPWLIVDGGCFLLTCPYPPVVDDVRLLLTYPCRPGDSTPSPLVYCVCVYGQTIAKAKPPPARRMHGRRCIFCFKQHNVISKVILLVT